MSGDLLVVLARVAHLLTAGIWVGGAIVYAVSGRPAPGIGARPFRWLVGICLWALAISGALLLADRLTETRTTALYVALLAAKLVLVGLMVLASGALAPSAVARLRRRSLGDTPGAERSHWLRGPYLVLWLGVGVYALGAAMAVSYVRALAAR